MLNSKSCAIKLVSMNWRRATNAKVCARVTCGMATLVLTMVSQSTPFFSNPSFEYISQGEEGRLGEGFLPEWWFESGNILPGADTYSLDNTFGLHPSSSGNFPGVVPKHGNRFIALRKTSAGTESAGSPLWDCQPNRIYRLGAWIHLSARAGQNYPVNVTATVDGADRGVLASAQSASQGWVYGYLDFPHADFSNPFVKLEPAAPLGGTPYVAIDQLTVSDVTSLYGPVARNDAIRLESGKTSEISISELIGNDTLGQVPSFHVYVNSRSDCTVQVLDDNTVVISPNPQFVSSAYFTYILETQYGSAQGRVDIEYNLPAYYFEKTSFVEYADVNGFGTVAGTYLTQNGSTHAGVIGFSYLTDPQGGEVFVTALNNPGTGVGYVRRSGRDLPFTYATNYNWLPTVGNRSAQALDINDAGTVAGWYENTSGARQACIWKNGKLIPVGPASNSSRATAVGADGLVFGEFTQGARQRVFTWKDGISTVLAIPNGTNAVANDLLSGTILGWPTASSSTGVTWNPSTGDWTALGTSTNPTEAFSGKAGSEIVNGVPQPYPLIYRNVLAWNRWTRKDIDLPPRRIVRQDDGREHLIMEAGSGGTTALYVYRRRTPQDWERTRGIGEVAISTPSVVGGTLLKVGYVGDPYESITVQSNAADVVPTQTVVPDASGALWINTNPTGVNRDVALSFSPSYSYPPADNPYPIQVLASSSQTITGTWDSRLSGMPASVVQVQALLIPRFSASPISAAVVLTGSSYRIDANVIPGNYDLVVQGTRMLSARINNLALAGGTLVRNLVLRTGDADGDDSVSFFDYLILSDAFDTANGDARFAALADFNGDGEVNLFDYLLFSVFYDEVGEA